MELECRCGGDIILSAERIPRSYESRFIFHCLKCKVYRKIVAKYRDDAISTLLNMYGARIVTNRKLLKEEWDALPESVNDNITMGDRVLFNHEGVIIAGKIVGICPYYSFTTIKPVGFYFEIYTESGDFYEIPETDEIRKRKEAV